MKVKEFKERLGADSMPTGRLIAYIKDGLEEINMLTETHINLERIDITEDQRFYDLPHDYIRIIDIRCKNHLNSKDEYRSIPRGIGSVNNKDSDGV
tara:strand:+ start:697 stop:984 length:288 start_codon:yes stop_codon:yes gene_type:complete